VVEVVRREEVVEGIDPRRSRPLATGGFAETAGGSAMPCGLVFPAARAKLVDADCEPDVRPTALSYW
jgi:hypothetical protein